ncbi:MAG: tetratricopeptide repeat protein, partial [Bacteroidia bacterium]
MNKRIFFVIFLSVYSLTTVAQYSKGLQFFENGYYQQSIPYFKKDLNGKNKEKSLEKLAQALFKTRNFIEAESYYQQLIQISNIDPQNYLQYGQILLALGKINEAQAQFKTYTKLNPSDKRGELLVKACKEILKNKFQDEKEYTVTEVKSINTQYNEYCPVIHPKGIIYCSDKPHNYDYSAGTSFSIVKTNICLSEKTKNSNDSLQFNIPKAFGPEISKGQYNGPISFNSDYSLIAFNLVEEKSKNKTNKNTAKIYFAESKGHNWFNITSFPFNSNEYSCLHPALSPDGNTLVFASNMPDSYGDFDLYVSYKINSEWTKPQNLGNTINTPFNEVFPYISQSGTLYFSSNGHNSIGGLDIYYAEKDGKIWTNPINAGKTLNSTYDDFGITLNNTETSGFFSSNRKEGKSND